MSFNRTVKYTQRLGSYGDVTDFLAEGDSITITRPRPGINHPSVTLSISRLKEFLANVERAQERENRTFTALPTS